MRPSTTSCGRDFDLGRSPSRQWCGTYPQRAVAAKVQTSPARHVWVTLAGHGRRTGRRCDPTTTDVRETVHCSGATPHVELIDATRLREPVLAKQIGVNLTSVFDVDDFYLFD